MRLTSGYGPDKPEIWHANEIPHDERRQQHGYGRFEIPADLHVAEFTTARFQFTLGELAVPVGGQLAIAWRWPYDWSDPQTDDPTAAGYTTFEVTDAEGKPADVQLAAVYDAYHGIEPFHHSIALTVQAGRLTAGMQVRVVVGDRAGGGPGWRAPTCVLGHCGFLLLVDPRGVKRWTRLLASPKFPVLPGPPVKMVVMAATDAVIGHESWVIIRAEDAWGNATPAPGPACLTSADDSPAPIETIRVKLLADPPSCHYRINYAQPGLYRLEAACNSLETSFSNPIRVHAVPPPEQIYWGDLHSGQSLIGCGAKSLAENYAYGRDAAALQFITHQANDHYVTVDDWLETRDETKRFYEAGRYAALLGCEWSPPTCDGGDRNVIYRHDEPRLRRSDRFFTETDPDDEPDIPLAADFHQAFHGQQVLVNMHVGGRPTNLEWVDPTFERLAEIHSTHGISEWFINDALARGYHVGITAGTDGVMGRPGACHAGSRLVRNLRNGLTAVMARELTTEGLWEAFSERRCYATTGERIILGFSVNDAPMGSIITSDVGPEIRVSVIGAAPIEQIDLLCGAEVIHSWVVATPKLGEDHSPGPLRVLWTGAERQGPARAQRLVWDGMLEVTGGALKLLRPIGLESPLDVVEQVSPGEIRWRSITAGNDMGCEFELTGDDQTRCHFVSRPATFGFTPAQVRSLPYHHDAGPVGRSVTIGPAPRSDGPRHAQFTWRDEQFRAGEVPYWVRVIQVDRARAWSSPVYVTRTAP